MKKKWLITMIMFLSSVLLVSVLSAPALLACDEEEVIPLPIDKIVKEYKVLNEGLSSFFHERKIDDVEKFKKESDPETLKKVNGELQAYLKKKADKTYDDLLINGGEFIIGDNCAGVVTDVLYDESKIGNGEQPPPIIDLTVSVICKSEKPEDLGTLSFYLVASDYVQKKLNSVEYTVIGDLSIQLFQSPASFQQYIRDGVLQDMIIYVKPRKGEKVAWFPPYRKKNSGNFQIYGELIDPGQRIKVQKEAAKK